MYFGNIKYTFLKQTRTRRMDSKQGSCRPCLPSFVNSNQHREGIPLQMFAHWLCDWSMNDVFLPLCYLLVVECVSLYLLPLAVLHLMLQQLQFGGSLRFRLHCCPFAHITLISPFLHTFSGSFFSTPFQDCSNITHTNFKTDWLAKHYRWPVEFNISIHICA